MPEREYFESQEVIRLPPRESYKKVRLLFKAFHTYFIERGRYPGPAADRTSTTAEFVRVPLNRKNLCSSGSY
jgi:hypothetical protein